MATNKDVKETMEVNQEVTQAAEEKVVDPNELVEIHLFEDGDRYKDDVFVAVNGKTFQIKRGETVKVPRYVKEVLDNSMKQDKVAARYMKMKQDAYETDAKKLDI